MILERNSSRANVTFLAYEAENTRITAIMYAFAFANHVSFVFTYTWYLYSYIPSIRVQILSLDPISDSVS